MINAWLLWFLPLAMVPLILHLITLHRLRTVELSTFRFLMDSYIQQRRRVKLLEFLLMLLRTLFVAMIILMLARPVTSGMNWLTGQGGRDIAIIIDAGAPMGLRSGVTTAMERAIAASESLIKSLAPDDRVTLVIAADKPTTLITRPASETAQLSEALRAITPAAVPSNMAAAIDEVFANRQKSTRVACVITQANRRAWEGLGGHPVTQRITNDSRIVVFDISANEPISNLSITGDPPRSARNLVGLPVMLSVTVAHSAGDTPANTSLSVFLDNQQVTQVGFSLQPGQKTTRDISITPTKSGVIRGRFQLPDDAFAADNSYHFTLNVDAKLNVLIVTPAFPPPPAEPPDLFIRAALASPLEASMGASDERAIAQALSVSSVVYTAVSDAMLGSTDAVLLSGVPLDANLGPRLRRYVENGGGLFIMPGPAVDPAPYQIHLFDTGQAAPPDPLKPRNLSYLPPVGNPDRESQFQPLTSIDLSHPVLTAFNEPGIDFFSTARVYRWFPIRLPVNDERSRTTVLMRLPNRTPILVDMPAGEGRMLVAGFAATPDWSSLPLKPEFVPLMLRSVAYLRRAAGASAPSAVQPGEPAPIYISSRWSDARVEAIDPAGKSSSFPLHRSGTQLVGALLETQKPGNYTFRIQPNTPGAPERVDLGWSVNLQVSPADFAPLTQDRLVDLVKPAKVTYFKGSANDPVFASELSRRSELWRTLIIAMFIIIALEFALSTLKPDAPKTDPPNPPGNTARWRSLFELPWRTALRKVPGSMPTKNALSRPVRSSKP